MLICPVCRSQNLDAAKFCGNCGNPFTSENDSTSSLINCAQGHIYSVVYQYCPYCPQPGASDPADFATRVESAATVLAGTDPPNGGQAHNDFATRIDSGEMDFETVQTPAIKPTAPQNIPEQTEVIPAEIKSDQKQVRRESSTNPTVVEPQAGQPPAPKDFRTVVEPQAGQPPAPEDFRTVVEPQAPPVPDREEFKTVLEGSPAAPPLPVNPLPGNPEPVRTAPPPPPPVTQDRHTLVAPTTDNSPNLSRGKIVGWLITYSNNTDGTDYRIYTGYNRMGANPVCDIIIDDETVSGSHAIVVFRDGRCMVKDDLSRNGTFVNGREITEAHTLQNYDQIRIGNTTLTYISAERPQEV